MTQQSLWQFVSEQHEKLLTQITQHLGLTFLSLLLAIIVGLPLGILIARKRKLSENLFERRNILRIIHNLTLCGVGVFDI